MGFEPDLIMEKLGGIEKDLDQIRVGMDSQAERVDEYQKQVDDMKYQLADRMNAVTKAACHYTTDLMQDLDSSVETLASRQSITSLNRLLTATCAISIFNMAGIIVILLYVFGFFR